MPAGRKRPGLGLAIPDDTGDDEVGIVERRPKCVGQGIAKLAPFMDRARRFWRYMARDSAREGELLEQALHPLGVVGDVGIDFAVRPFEPGIGYQPRSAVARAGDVDHAEVAFFDDAV